MVPSVVTTKLTPAPGVETESRVSPVVLVFQEKQLARRTTTFWSDMKQWLSTPPKDRTDICHAICGVCHAGLSTNGLQWNEETPEMGKVLLCGHMLCQACYTDKKRETGSTSTDKPAMTSRDLPAAITSLQTATPDPEGSAELDYLCPVCEAWMECLRCRKPCAIATLPRPLEKARHVDLYWDERQLHLDERQTCWEVPRTLSEGQFEHRVCWDCNADHLRANGSQAVYEAMRTIQADDMLVEMQKTAKKVLAEQRRRERSAKFEGESGLFCP